MSPIARARGRGWAWFSAAAETPHNPEHSIDGESVEPCRIRDLEPDPYTDNGAQGRPVNPGALSSA